MDRVHNKRGIRISVQVLFFTFFLHVTALHAQLKSGSCFDYSGTLGKSTRIGISLYAQDQQLEGSYFYKDHLADIPLSGRYTSARDISLTEKDPGGEIRGTFLLHFAESDPS